MTIYRRDHFDAEWLIQMNTYHVPLLPDDGLSFNGTRRHGSKWFVANGCVGYAWDVDIPRQRIYTSNANPISGLDSLILENQSNVCAGAMLWDNPREPAAPVVFLKTVYCQFKFRIDEWVQPPNGSWMVGLTGFSGDIDGIWSHFQQVIGLISGYYPPVLNDPRPRLIMRVRTDAGVSGGLGCYTVGDGPGQICTLIDANNPLEVGRVYTLEMLRHIAADGKIMVWLDGNPVSTLTRENVPISYPSAINCVHIGPTGTIGLALPTDLPGARSRITIDDYIVADEPIGLTPLPFKLTVESNYPTRFYLGNNGPYFTPKAFILPSGTLPKIFVDPTYFDHFEINGVPMVEAASGQYWKEIWNVEPAVTGPPSSEYLIGMVNQAGYGGGDVRSITPPMYQDTVITLVYTQAPKPYHTIKIEATHNGTPIPVPAYLNGIDGVTPYERGILEGEHTPEVPLEINGGGEELEELWLDEFTSYDPRWGWGYNAGTGYKFLTTVEGYSVCESGITAESTSSEYSDCDLHTFFSISETDEFIIEMRLRTTDDNGITGIGKGSRGWGFWDGSMMGVNLAWFGSASPESDPYLAGFHAMVKRDNVFVLHEDVSYIDMRQWHVYRIDLLKSGTEFRVDGVLVASTSVRPRTLNQLNLWIDNFVFQFVDGELQRGYLDVDQSQKMYIDWVRLSIPPRKT